MNGGVGTDAAGGADASDLDDVREDADAQGTQQRLGDRATGHASRGFTRAGPLEHVADVAEAVLLRTDQVRVPRPGQVHLGQLRRDRPGIHPLLPVGVIAVDHLQRDRTPERPAVPDAGRDLHPVALDLHTAAAAVTELAASEIAVQRLAVELEPGGQTLDDAGEAGAVRLPGGGQFQAHARIQLRREDQPAAPAPGRPNRPGGPGRPLRLGAPEHRSRGSAARCPDTMGRRPRGARRPVRRSAVLCRGRAYRSRPPPLCLRYSSEPHLRARARLCALTRRLGAPWVRGRPPASPPRVPCDR